jgi:hypothetical protein
MNRSVNIGRDAIGNINAIGNQNSIDANMEAKLVRTTLPALSSVDISRELEQIRSILKQVGGEHTSKIVRALEDADEEAKKIDPEKDEIGKALSRALEYAKTGSGFAEEVGKLTPYLTNAVAWLGSNWHHLLTAVGLAV